MIQLSSADLEVFIDALASGDEEGARQVATNVIAADEGGVRLVVDELIPRAQHEVGALWESGAWTVAQEHIATDICGRIVATLAAELPAPPSTARPVLVVCAEGEWHSLATNTGAVALQLAGWRPVLMGPSVSSSQLAAAIFDAGPDLVALSCSMVANLPGAHRMILTAMDTGTPIIVGGAGFGEAGEWAERLGANAWCSSPFEMAATIASLDSRGPRRSDAYAAHREEIGLLDALYADIVTQLSLNLGVDQALDGQLASGGIWTLRTLYSALLCDAPEILTHQFRWHEGRARLGSALPSAVIARALLNALPAEVPTARRWVEKSAARAVVEV